MVLCSKTRTLNPSFAAKFITFGKRMEFVKSSCYSIPLWLQCTIDEDMMRK